jgi:DNA (cytosine-5)-methyltransferase 1
MKVLDLFSGIGGFSLGLERAGFETVAFVENNLACHRVLKKHWSEVPIYEDVKNVRFEKGFADLICGGFPCQDISLAGKGEGLDGKRSGLWFEFHRLIKEIKPKYVIAENVSALRTRGLDKVLSSLMEIGYAAEWHCIPASTIGAPHKRDRIWIIGYSNNITGIQKDSPIMSSRSIREAWESNSWGHWRQVSRDNRVVPQSISIGVGYGLPYRMDRMKQLGNAVVPQIPEMIGKAIIEFDRRTQETMRG